MSFFLQSGACPNAKDKSGFTPLWSAFNSGDEEAISYLLENGADPHVLVVPPLRYNLFDTRTYPPLFWAVAKKFENIVGKLLQITDDPSHLLLPRNLKADDLSVLLMAVNNGSYKIVDILLTFDMDIISCHDGLLRAMEFGDTDIASLIIQKGIQDHWMINQHGKELFLTASCLGFPQVVRALLDAGMDPKTRAPPDGISIRWCYRNESDPAGFPGYSSESIDDEPTALDLAAQYGQHEVTQELLENMENPDLKSSLRHAIDGGHVKVIKILLHYGAELDLETGGSSILSTAARRGHTEFVVFLLDRGISASSDIDQTCHPMLDSVLYMHHDVVQAFLDKKVDPNTTDNMGRSGLILAAQTAQLDMVEMFLRYGGLVNFTDRLGRTPLLFGTLMRSYAIVQVLLENGSTDLETKSCAARTPVSVALEFNFLEICRLFSSYPVENSQLKRHEQMFQSERESLSFSQGAEDEWMADPFSNSDMPGEVSPSVSDDEARDKIHQCDMCDRLILDAEPFFTCSICKNASFAGLLVCVECVEGKIGCFDLLHTLEKQATIDGKRVAVEKKIRWAHAISLVPSFTCK